MRFREQDIKENVTEIREPALGGKPGYAVRCLDADLRVCSLGFVCDAFFSNCRTKSKMRLFFHVM